MAQIETQTVVSSSGLRGAIVHTDAATRDRAAQVVVEFEDGRRVVVSQAALVRVADGGYRLPVDLDQLNSAQDAQLVNTGETVVLPVIEEIVSVGKRAVERGGVRVVKQVHTREETVDVPLLHEQFEVERVAVNRVVAEAVPVRYEGETMIVPVLEEVLVVEKRLMLKEELHITRRQTTVSQPQQVTLRREEVVVERIAEEQRG